MTSMDPYEWINRQNNPIVFARLLLVMITKLGNWLHIDIRDILEDSHLQLAACLLFWTTCRLTKKLHTAV